MPGVVYLLLLAFVAATVVLFRERRRLARDNGDLRGRFGGVADVDDLKRALEVEVRKLQEQRDQLRETVVLGGEQAELQSWGFYQRQYDFDDADAYKAESDKIRSRQKEMVKKGRAAICDTEWTVQGSRAKGKKMAAEHMKLMLRAFNGECDAAVARVKHNNVVAQLGRIEKAHTAINKLGKAKGCNITDAYLKLKLQELRITHEYEEKKQEEREEQRRIKELMREEQRVEKERRKAIAEAEKEEKLRAKLLQELEAKFAAASEAERLALEKELQEARDALASTQRAIAQAQLTRSGHVYIISNIGSFGQHVYKIGMTRRLEPLDRVRELGDASVPFHFDVHAMIYSDDAPALETKLHQELDRYRVNKVNSRKEFFHVELGRIAACVQRNRADFKLTLLAEAREYRESQALAGPPRPSQPPRYAYEAEAAE